MEPMSLSALAALIGVIGGTVSLANQLFRPGETTKQGFGPLPGPDLPTGTHLRVDIDSVDDEARVSFNGAVLPSIGRNEKKSKEVVVARGLNRLYVVVVNSGSGRWSLRVNIQDLTHGREYYSMPHPYGSSDTYFPGDKIINRIFVWEFKGV